MNAARGPHGGGSTTLPPAEERARLLDAFTKVASEYGYAQTTVEDVASRARLPVSSFHAHFRDLQQCLLAAYDTFFDHLIGEIEDSMDPEASWPLQVRAGVDAAVGFVVESAGVARLFAVDALAAGPPAVDRYIAAIERIVALLRLGRSRSQQAEALPLMTEAVLASGAVSLVTGALLAEEQARLPELKSHLIEVLLLPYVGPAEAQRLAA